MKREIKYRFVVNEDKRVVVALSSFAGETVRGVARCSPNDTFDVELGKKLAVARCDYKIACKKVDRAFQMVDFYRDFSDRIQKKLENVLKYKEDAIYMAEKATDELQNLESSL